MGPTRDEHLDRERQNASVCDWNGKPDGVFRDVCQRSYFLFPHWIVALAGYSRADSGRRSGCSFERSAGREVAGAVDVCAGGGYGYFLEFAGFVEDLGLRTVPTPVTIKCGVNVQKTVSVNNF